MFSGWQKAGQIWRTGSFISPASLWWRRGRRGRVCSRSTERTLGWRVPQRLWAGEAGKTRVISDTLCLSHFWAQAPNVCFSGKTSSHVCIWTCVCACMYVWGGCMCTHSLTRVFMCVHVGVLALSMCVWCVHVCMFVCGLNRVCSFVCVTTKSLTIVTMKIITAKAAGALTCLTSWKRMRRNCTLRWSWKRDVDATRTTHPRCSSLHLSKQIIIKWTAQAQILQLRLLPCFWYVSLVCVLSLIQILYRKKKPMDRRADAVGLTISVP